jgi:hypothetical protein
VSNHNKRNETFFLSSIFCSDVRFLIYGHFSLKQKIIQEIAKKRYYSGKKLMLGKFMAVTK